MSTNNNKPTNDRTREQHADYEVYASMEDGNRYELVDGMLELMSPGPNLLHQVISFQIQKRIADTCEQEYIILDAPFDLILSPTEVRQPDLAIIHRSRFHILSKRGVEGPPDVVVEILSPSTLKRDKIHKSRTYAAFGIAEYWIVDPLSGSLEQYELKDGLYQLNNVFIGDEPVQSTSMPCLSFTMAAVMKYVEELPL
ncbi:hypothetical protein SY83_05435 [Paenibacillus swuensis]|uniref:Putative restriction endonuclease domain-containing protein n=1 Tax=Paenibacillus swuensis TaxID=1178515 RepID=A0A172TFX4_9BACL|nr:Uma2 family endonuclease [Paenibacillus swuensis]ANE45836.1 hypothetical protein SY83_05435 [Paenibacillus swuensis]